MTLKRLIVGSVVAGGLAVGALGLGAGVANAEPWHGPGPGWVHPGRPDIRWQDRDGYDRAVRDPGPSSTTASG
jgi:hypothetical protein